MVNTLAAAPRAVMDALVSTYSISLGTPVDATTATRARERANQDALTAALRRVLAIEAARLAPVVPYPSIDDATAARDRVAAILDEQAALAGDDAYPALVDLRSQVLRAVPGGTAFASIVPVTRRVATPSLLLAYQLYGSVDLEEDIIARNRVRHPGFIAGALKVLSDG
jgi:prophage DNA circulation protein